MSSRPTILFDVMGTLVKDPFPSVFTRFFDCSLEELFARKSPTAWLRFEFGEIDEATFFDQFFRDEAPVDGPKLRERVFAAYEWIEGMPQLLKDLKAGGTDLHAFSNYPDWYLAIERKLGISEYLPWTSVSCNTALRKPDPAAYQETARLAGVQPQDCLLIDDSEPNIHAARGLGMAAVKFSGAADLRHELGSRGLL